MQDLPIGGHKPNRQIFCDGDKFAIIGKASRSFRQLNHMGGANDVFPTFHPAPGFLSQMEGLMERDFAPTGKAGKAVPKLGSPEPWTAQTASFWSTDSASSVRVPRTNRYTNRFVSTTITIVPAASGDSAWHRSAARFAE